MLKTVLKRIRYKKIIIDLINLYLATIGLVGVGYAHQVINNIDFPAELLTYEGFLKFTNHMYCYMLVIKFSIFLFGLLVLNKNVYLNPKIASIETVTFGDKTLYIVRERRKER